MESEEGMIVSFKMMAENTNPDMEQKCMYFDEATQSMSSDGCVFLNIDTENSLVICRCTHMTNFFGTLANKFRSKFGNANWGLFGPQKFQKPLWENLGFI